MPRHSGISGNFLDLGLGCRFVRCSYSSCPCTERGGVIMIRVFLQTHPVFSAPGFSVSPCVISRGCSAIFYRLSLVSLRGFMIWVGERVAGLSSIPSWAISAMGVLRSSLRFGFSLRGADPFACVSPALRHAESFSAWTLFGYRGCFDPCVVGLLA